MPVSVSHIYIKSFYHFQIIYKMVSKFSDKVE